MFLQLIFLLCALIISLHLYFRYNREARLIYKIKGPKEMFLFGNVFDLFITPEQLFYSQIKWRKMYGDIWRLSGFNYRVVYLYKPEYIEAVLSSIRYLDKKIPYSFLYPWLRGGLLTSTGEKWHRRRKMLTPAFHFLILKKFLGIFCERTQELIETIENEVDRDKSELFPLISKATLSVICETSMGTIMQGDSYSITSKYFTPLQTATQSFVYRVTRVWLYSDLLFKFTRFAKIQKEALEILHNFTTAIIQYRRDYRKNNDVTGYHDINDEYGKKTKVAMLDLLLDEEKKGQINEEGIKEEVDTFIFEGSDTTAAALCFMMMRIANEPEIQNSIYEEMKTIFGESQRTPTIEDLSQMKYLECCFKESLRLYPSVHFMSRYFTEEIKIGDYIVPRNTMCNINVFDIHRNPDTFPEPEKFIPERFLPENCTTRHPYAYIPFSAGPRNCIGQKFAMMEMKTVMSSLLRRFKLEPVTRPEDLVFKADVILRTTHPVYVRFRKRNSKC